jgi:NADH-quinone oxidoreductase subunit D
MAEPRRYTTTRLQPEGTYQAPEQPVVPVRVPSGVDGVGTENLVINMGPQHPSTHGVLRLLIEVDGERIVAAEGSIGYLHRGIEKLSESRRYHQLGTLMDRSDYLSGIHTELAAAMATEQLAGIEVPEKALWLRSLMSEVTRISSHVVFYGTLGLDAGGMGQFLYAVRDREKLLDILDSVTGSRMMFNYVRPGGVLNDITPEDAAALRTFATEFPKYLQEYHDLLTGNEIFERRLRDVAVMDRATAIAYGASGPVLRGSGVAYDVRKERPYAAYDQLTFEVPVGTVGDSWDRYMVRMEELAISNDLILQCLDGMPEGDHMAKVPKVLRPPAGEAWAEVESPRGLLGVHLISDGSDVPARLHLRGPSLYNLQTMEDFLPGLFIADAVVGVGSLDIVLGEIDR